jgi:hypothetical protein
MTDLPTVIQDNFSGGFPYYDRQGNPIGMWEWSRLFGDLHYKRIARVSVRGVRVSTVWLGLDHGWCNSAPLIFETMCFVQRRDRHKHWDAVDYCERYSTEIEARLGHERVVNRLRARGSAARLW